MNPAAVKTILIDLPVAIIKGVSAVWDSKYAREHLADGLGKIESTAQLLQARASAAGLPTTLVGCVALQNLNAALQRVAEALQQLQEELDGTEADLGQGPATGGAAAGSPAGKQGVEPCLSLEQNNRFLLNQVIAYTLAW